MDTKAPGGAAPAVAPVQNTSYATSLGSRSGRFVVRALENATGRRGLIRRAQGYEDELAQGAHFFDVMVARYGLSLKVVAGRLDAIPRQGPVIFVANHPYGVLDGLMLGYLMGLRRDDFRIMAHSVFGDAAGLDRSVLPISFAGDRRAVALNLATRRIALDHLQSGGAVGVFPGGTVSTATRPFGIPIDPVWRSFTARLVAKTRAVVVPVFFEGQTSRLFQIASHVHPCLRLGLLVREFRHRVDMPVRLVIGAPIERDVLDPLCRDAKGMMDFLRKATYNLSPEPIGAYEYGFECK